MILLIFKKLLFSTHYLKRRRLKTTRRRGVAVFVVLMLIALTLSLSYAMVRTQSVSFMIQNNADRRLSAQQTAVTGMSIALKKMQQSDWAGFGSTLNGTISTTDSFTAVYTFGDPTLTAASSDYNDYPFRGTIAVAAKSADPLNPQNIATYQITSVVRLVPRQLSDEPTDWNTMQQYSFYQSDVDRFEVDIPCQITGTVRIQGMLLIAPHYPDSYDAWWYYLRDLYNMQAWGGLPDYRPFTGKVYLPYSGQDVTHLDALRSTLAVPTVNTAPKSPSSDWVNLSGVSTYQLYPGGPVYNIPQVPAILQSTTLGPDPLTNPLGIYYCNSSLTIKNDVTIRGSLICKNNLIIDGTNVDFEPVELPGLFGAGTSVRLPAITCQKFNIKATATTGKINGLVAVFNAFTIEKASETQSFPIIGRVIAKQFLIQERTPWDTIDWNYYYYFAFWNQNPFISHFFPVFMGNKGRNPKPLLTIKPDTVPITYHWPTPNSSVFMINPADGALRWELVKWTENP